MNKVAIIDVLLVCASVFFLKQPILAQNGDCGNGLIQRLAVDGRGWIDPTPPAQGVRMRQAPGEAEVARLEPGEEFTVLDGPQCFDTYSWFEVETDDGKRGWIAEGVEAGEYFVDPLVSTEIDIDIINCNGDPAPFEVGQYVNLTRNPTEIDLFYGHPLVDGGYFSIGTYFQNSLEDAEYYLPLLGQPDNLSADYPITRGAACVNGSYVWQIRTDIAWFWLDESFLTLSDNQPDVESVFSPKPVSLTEPPALLVSPELQISWDGSGGGGGGALQLVDDGCLGTVEDITKTYEYTCVAVYPFEPDGAVDIQIKQADGMLIYETTQSIEPIDLIFTSETQPVVSTHGVKVYIPTKFGMTSGMYVVNASTESTAHNVSFVFQEDYSYDYKQTDADVPVIVSVCESSEPVLMGANFVPNTDIELVFVSKTDFVDNGGAGTISYEETYRWVITTGDNGDFLATIDLDLPEGYFVIADESGDWIPNFPEQQTFFGDFAPLATGMRTDCADIDYTIPDFIATSVVDTPTDFILQSGQQYATTLNEPHSWIFMGDSEQQITLSVESDEMDVLVKIQSSDGIILIDDDDSGTRTNAFIDGFVLPETGVYTVVVSSWGDKTGQYMIKLDMKSGQTTVVEEASETESSPTMAPADTATPLPTATQQTGFVCTGAPTSRLEVGMTAQQSLDNDPIRVRAEPRSGTTVQYLLYPDQQVTIIGGPECNALDTGSALVWWEIENSDELRGWVAEGTNESYFIVPVE